MVCVCFQILERDGSDIVPPEFQRFVDADAVHFIENICKFVVFEGIHRRVVSASECVCTCLYIFI